MCQIKVIASAGVQIERIENVKVYCLFFKQCIVKYCHYGFRKSHFETVDLILRKHLLLTRVLYFEIELTGKKNNSLDSCS